MATSVEEKKNETKKALEHGADKAKEKADKAKSMMEDVADKAQGAGEYVKDKADQGVSYAGQGMESLGETIREKGPQKGVLGKANTAVAGALEQSGEYLHEKGLSGMASDVTTLIKNHPIPSVLIALGLGFVVARMTSRS